MKKISFAGALLVGISTAHAADFKTGYAPVNGIRHPEIAHKLVVASAMTKRDGMVPQFWESIRTATLDTMPAEFKEAYVKTAPHPNLQKYFEKSVKRILEFKDWPDSMVKSIQAPTLILIGDADIVRPEHAVEMYRTIPHASLAILPGVNHMAMVDHWPVAMIETFLDEPMPESKTTQH